MIKKLNVSFNVFSRIGIPVRQCTVCGIEPPHSRPSVTDYPGYTKRVNESSKEGVRAMEKIILLQKSPLSFFSSFFSFFLQPSKCRKQKRVWINVDHVGVSVHTHHHHHTTTYRYYLMRYDECNRLLGSLNREPLNQCIANEMRGREGGRERKGKKKEKGHDNISVDLPRPSERVSHGIPSPRGVRGKDSRITLLSNRLNTVCGFPLHSVGNPLTDLFIVTMVATPRVLLSGVLLASGAFGGEGQAGYGIVRCDSPDIYGIIVVDPYLG